MQRLYEPLAYADDSDAGSYWRTTVEDREWSAVSGDLETDFAVIGSGYTGLSAALHLARDHGASVKVLDAKQPGWGASGRNGGFCCLGGAAADTGTLKARFGQQKIDAFHGAMRGAVDMVDGLLDQYGIDADRHSDGETLLAHTDRSVDVLKDEAERVRTAYGVEPKLIAGDDLVDHGMGGAGFHGAVTTPIGFALNPRKYALGLAAAAEREGALIFGNTPVTSIKQSNGCYRLSTPTGIVTAKHLLLATNGYSSDDVPPWMAGRYLPVQSSILVTRELTDDELAAQGWTTHQMCYDTRHLLHYFRLMPNRRMLFGMRGATKASPKAFEATKRILRAEFETMFPAWAQVETPHFWTGLLCLSRGLTPYVGPLGDWPNAFTAFAYHGNGVAMGTYAGALMADLAAGVENPKRPLPDLMAAPPKKFELGRWRRSLLPLAHRWYEWQDRG
ncbi:NAD(P)/FAD-dependent oxidoreductase [Aliiroseovarius sp. YM-037]|uniref:NAD(P)/FAD-dependent oxidoreductase n=1 Tax=Aliiroseovarius sp. YM-037 TaxID=3341728 RepID=UPI003A801F1C